MRRKRRAGAKAREMKIIVTTTWSRELGLELPTPSIMHACLSVRREFRHLLTGLRIRNAGTREPGSQSHPVGEREARDTASADAARATRLTGRARRRAPGGARPLPPAVRPPWPPRHSSRPSVQQPSRAGSSRLIPGDCSPHTDISGGISGSRKDLGVSSPSVRGTHDKPRIQRVGLSL